MPLLEYMEYAYATSQLFKNAHAQTAGVRLNKYPSIYCWDDNYGKGEPNVSAALYDWGGPIGSTGIWAPHRVLRDGTDVSANLGSGMHARMHGAMSASTYGMLCIVNPRDNVSQSGSQTLTQGDINTLIGTDHDLYELNDSDHAWPAYLLNFTQAGGAAYQMLYPHPVDDPFSRADGTSHDGSQVTDKTQAVGTNVITVPERAGRIYQVVPA